MNIFFGLVIILIAAILIYAVMLGQSKPKLMRLKTGVVDKDMIAGRWNTIKLTSESGPSGLKNSVNEADKLLDFAMKQLGFPGETMGERLKVADRNFSNRNKVWEAHKLRNSMAHDIDFDLVPSMAKEALKSFERALKDLGAL